MSIDYIEKGAGLHDAVLAAGHTLYQKNGVWESTNDTAVQAIINSYNPLADQKAARILAIKTEGLARMNALFPAIETLDEVTLLAEFWLSIVAGSRNPTVSFKKIIDIYQAAKTAVTGVNACTTKAQIDAVTVSWPA